ncbi:MAG TPA: MFS transporter [Burkholderiales bacterium]|nr:MFS transporter [Burkholderiales bacterium]
MGSSVPPADEESRQYPYWRRNRLVLPLANLICGFGWAICWPFLPLMLRDLGVHEHLETWTGNMLLAFYLVSFTVNPVWGSIADHYGRKPMVLRAMFGIGVMMLLVPIAPTPIWFAVMLMMVAIFNGFTPAGVALLVANTPPKRIGSTVSLAQTGGLVGQAIGPAAGVALAALVTHQHWLFWISGAFMLTGGVLVLFFVHEVKKLASGPWRLRWLGGLRDVLKVKRVGPLFFLAFLFSVMWNGSVTNVTMFVMDLLKAQPGADADAEAFWVGTAAVASAVSMLAAMPVWGRVLDRIGPRRVLAYCAVGAIVSHLPLLVLQTPLQLVLARIAFGLSSAGMQASIIFLLRLESPPGMDARTLSYATAFQFFGMGIAPFLAGLIGPVAGLRAYFALIIVLMGIGLALWQRVDKDKAEGGSRKAE